jgi:hypothetical protein
VRLFNVGNQGVRILIWRWICRNELGASVREQFLECRDTLLALDILATCSPNRSLTMFKMLSSSRLGDRALQIANRAYILSAVLLIWSYW